MGFKVPDFTERAALAREAKERALEKLRAKPAPDPAAIAAKVEAAAAKPLTAEEQKAIRDARYAARKARKR
jgi:hypothetical protein